MENKKLYRQGKFWMGIISLCIIIIISLLFFFLEENKDDEIMLKFDSNPLMEYSVNSSLKLVQNCSEIHGILIKPKERLSPSEKKGFIYGMVLTLGYPSNSSNLISIYLDYPECNVHYKKTYYNFSDLPEGDDCIDKNKTICFIEWEELE